MHGIQNSNKSDGKNAPLYQGSNDLSYTVSDINYSTYTLTVIDAVILDFIDPSDDFIVITNYEDIPLNLISYTTANNLTTFKFEVDYDYRKSFPSIKVGDKVSMTPILERSSKTKIPVLPFSYHVRENNIYLKWKSTYPKFRIRYKKLNDSTWLYVDTDEMRYDLVDLDFNSEYLVEMLQHDNLNYSDYSQRVIVKILPS